MPRRTAAAASVLLTILLVLVTQSVGPASATTSHQPGTTVVLSYGSGASAHPYRV